MTLLDREWNVADDEALKDQLQQLVSDLQSELSSAGALPMQLALLEGITTTGTVNLKFGGVSAVSVPSAASVVAMLPRPDKSASNQFCGVLRKATTGTVTAKTTSLVNGASSVTVPAVIGLHLYWCDGTNFWTVET